jgi:hypothetical protein
MAELLIRKWRLTVLRVRLEFERVPMVSTELLGYPDGTARTVWTGRYPIGSFGLTEGRTPPTTLTVPDELAVGVARELRERLPGNAALWLRLVPPYGQLGAVPWEPALAGTGVPLVRVPDRLPAAVDPGRTFTLAIVISARTGTGWTAPYVRTLLAGLRQRGWPLDVHVFADAGTLAQLANLTWGESWQHLHQPADAYRVSQARSERGVTQFRRNRLTTSVSPGAVPGRVWADWIVNGLGGRAARAVHVVTDAAWNGDRPVLAVSPDPGVGYDLTDCVFVDADQVRTLSDRLGAATLSFGSPPDNPADLATRMIADSLGRQRNGPTLYSSIAADPYGAGLVGAYAYLVERDAEIPQDPSLFAYLQPEHVLGSLDQPWPDDLGRRPTPAGAAADPGPDPVPQPPPVPDELGEYYSSLPEVPTWVASAERFVEGTRAGLTGAPREGFEVKSSYDSGTTAALAEIRDLVTRHVRESS